MLTLPLLLCYTLLLFRSVLAQEDIMCVEDEECLILISCKQLLPLIHIAKETLKEYHCGWDGHMPKVCCPYQVPSVNSVRSLNLLNVLQPVTREPTLTDATSVNDEIRNPYNDDYYDVSQENFQNINNEEDLPEANPDAVIMMSEEDDHDQCISLSICKELQPLVKTARELLKEFHCGWDGTMPKVYCPSRKSVNSFTRFNFGNPSQPVTQKPLLGKLLPISTDNNIRPELIPKFNVITQKFSKIVNCGYSPGSNRILNGKNVAVDEYPWLALLEYVTGYFGCAGSVISPKFILTAAHCFDGTYGHPSQVRLAEYNTSSFPIDYVEVEGGGWENVTVQIVKVKTIYSHPKYSRSLAIHDIGLIKMAETVDLNGDFIKAICLPYLNFMPEFETTTNFTVAGWGKIDNRLTFSEVKLQIPVPFVPWNKCSPTKNDIIMNTQICAGGLAGQDSCQGDSGTPLMYEKDTIYYAVGVVSYGPKTCGLEGQAAKHTNVYSYMSWITEVMNGKYD